MLALTLDTTYFRALRLGTEVKPLAYTDIHSPSAHPPAPLWCENMIPSLSSSSNPLPLLLFSQSPCCSELKGIRKHNSQEVHYHGTPRSLSSSLPFPLFHVLGASCSHSRPFLFPGPCFRRSQFTSALHRCSCDISEGF